MNFYSLYDYLPFSVIDASVEAVNTALFEQFKSSPYLVLLTNLWVKSDGFLFIRYRQGKNVFIRKEPHFRIALRAGFIALGTKLEYDVRPVGKKEGTPGRPHGRPTPASRATPALGSLPSVALSSGWSGQV